MFNALFLTPSPHFITTIKLQPTFIANDVSTLDKSLLTSVTGIYFLEPGHSGKLMLYPQPKETVFDR